MDSVAKLRQLLKRDMDARVPVQTVWATCKGVDMAKGTMDAERDGLEYNDVLIGLGGDKLAPMVGCQVLLGLVENKPAATFLIHAEETEQRHINGDAFGGLVRADDVAQALSSLQQDVNSLKQVFATWVPVTQDGGAALKASAASWFAQPLAVTQSTQLQNPKVSHG